MKIDARTSDAVALALRFKCPIFTYEDVLSKAGIILDKTLEDDLIFEEEQEETSEEKGLKNLTLSKLKKLLKNKVSCYK